MRASPFMEGLRQHMLVRHYSKRTIDSYLYWVRYYIRFNGKRHPAEMGQEKVMAKSRKDKRAFLSCRVWS